jgi:hypothetical protein
MRAMHSFRGPAVHRVAAHGGYGVHRRAPPRAAARRHAGCCPLHHPWLIRRGSERQGYWLRPWPCEGAPAVRAARRTAAQRLRRGHSALHHCLLSLVLSGKHACACFPALQKIMRSPSAIPDSSIRVCNPNSSRARAERARRAIDGTNRLDNTGANESCYRV